MLETDPILIQLHNDEKEKSKIHTLLSGTFSYLESAENNSVAVKSFKCTRGHFVLETLDSKGTTVAWNGFSRKNRGVPAGLLPSGEMVMNVLLGRNAGIDLDPTKNYMIVSERNRSKIMFNNSGNPKETEIVNFYPFPYYEEMPIFEKFMILRAIVGIKRTMLRNDLIAEATNEIAHRSLGLSPYELWESLGKLVSVGIESGLVEETSRGIKIVGSRFTSRKTFMEIYDRYYLRINKTTLYDF